MCKVPKVYRKKPADIKAIKWTGDNYVDICLFMGREAEMSNDGLQIIITTLKGKVKAVIGDYIICGLDGSFYPCQEDIFLSTYEEVSNVQDI